MAKKKKKLTDTTYQDMLFVDPAFVRRDLKKTLLVSTLVFAILISWWLFQENSQLLF